jgi:hypothetical protein
MLGVEEYKNGAERCQARRVAHLPRAKLWHRRRVLI